MAKSDVTRRSFVGAAAMATAASAKPTVKSAGKPALLGGEPLRTAPWPSWPQIRQNDETAWMDVLKSGRWGRGGGRYAEKFEEIWAAKLGAKHCLATANGTSALI